MGLSDIAVRRRVAMLMLTLVVALFGGIAFTRLGLDFFPEMEYPLVSVVTSYGQVSPEEVEEHVTKPIETVVATVTDVESVKSTSIEGLSVVMVEFARGTNLDFAAQDVREKVSLVEDWLPEEADKPGVYKFNMADMPVMVYACVGMENTQVLRDFLDDTVKPRLERQEGVASAFVLGGLEKEIQVVLHRDRMEAHNVSIQQVMGALRGANVNLSGGHIMLGTSEYALRMTGRYRSLEEIGDTVVAMGAGGPVRIRDMAEVRLAYKEQRSMTRANRHEAVMMAIMKQSGANTATATDRVKAEIDQMYREGYIPKDVKMYPVMDQGRIIHKITSSALRDALLGALLAVVLLYLFLLNWRPTFAIAVAIPLSVLATFFALWVAGYTLNMVTIMGLALCVGMMVDCSVVVIENVFRHLEEGLNRFDAARTGTREVILAVTASTFTNMAVFIPLLIVPGITAQIARPLAVTVCIGVFMSLVVSVTLVPAIAATLFRRRRGRSFSTAGRLFTKVRDAYKVALGKALDNRWKVIGTAALLFCLTLLLATRLGASFTPESDMPMLMLKVRMPVGTPIAETDALVQEIENAALAQKETLYVMVMVGRSEMGKQDLSTGFAPTDVHEATIMIRIVDKEDRQRLASEIEKAIFDALPKTNARITSVDMSTAMLSFGAEAPIEIKVLGKDIDEIERICKEIYKRAVKVEGFTNADYSFREGRPEITARPQRDRAEQAGLPVAVIGDAITTAFEGKVATIYRHGGEEIDVRVRLAEEDRDSIEDLKALPVASMGGMLLRLDQVAEIGTGRGPEKILREEQIRKGTVTGDATGRDLASVVADIKKVVSGLRKPGYFIEYGGSYELMLESFFWLMIAFIVSVVLVYMIMAAQFEHFSHPLVVMFTVPLGIIGSITAVAILGAEISMVVLLGVVVLAGIVVNNAIVMIDFVNQLKSKGLKRREALIEGAALRLRPILITSLTTILGMVPMALSMGQGHEVRNPFGAAVAGGLLFGMVLTLFVIPCIYSVIDRFSSGFSEKARRMFHGDEDERSRPDREA